MGPEGAGQRTNQSPSPRQAEPPALPTPTLALVEEKRETVRTAAAVRITAVVEEEAAAVGVVVVDENAKELEGGLAADGVGEARAWANLARWVSV